ncbi:MAG: hypothetical protein JNM71_05155 [Flavobacterium lindanitolerans]|uniref:hypothetical protein n=1 Tax=Flavobacterium lindanitolerans TaxID=428988 RepID=UPI001A5749BC|nr:hypothetical protein [Flavobacterium lindanitolerans]MBL7867386.1 hypothetical protein [Flavobacterium lindanitolerans]
MSKVNQKSDLDVSANISKYIAEYQYSDREMVERGNELMENFIRTMAEDNSSATIKSTDKGEPAIVIAEIFKHAKKEVKIYTGSLADIFTNDVSSFTSLNEFLRSGKSLKIALANASKPKPIFQDLLSGYIKHSEGRFQVRGANNAFHENMDDILNERTDFIVDDRNAFSLTVYPESGLRMPLYSLYSFNNEEYSKQLDKAFSSELFKKCPSLF